jgi:hypothetical protein
VRIRTLRGKSRGHLAVGLVLFLLGREGLAVDEQVFGPEQSDPLGSEQLDRLGILRLLDVGGEHDLRAVQCHGRFVPQHPEPLFHRQTSLDQFAVFKESLLGRVEEKASVESVQKRIIPGGKLADHFLKADDRRDLERTGHDGRVRGAAAAFSSEPEHHFFVEHRRRRRCQVFADDNARLLEVAQFGGVGTAQQIVQDPRCYIAHVRGTFAQVIIINRGQRGRVPFRDLLESVGNVHPFGVNHAGDFIDEGGVLQYQQVGVEDAGVVCTHRLPDLSLHLEDLMAGLDQCAFQPG